MKLDLRFVSALVVIFVFLFTAAACGNSNNNGDSNDSGSTGDTIGDDTGTETGHVSDASDDADTETEQSSDVDSVEKVGTSVFPVVASGWVSQEENDFHMQGAWYTFGCDAATVTPEGEVVRGDNGICFSGSSPVVVDGDDEGDDLDWDAMWGAGMGFDVCAFGEEEADTALVNTKNRMGECPFNETLADDIIGVQMDIKGTLTSRDGLRVMFNEGDNVANAFVETSAVPGTTTALFKDATVSYNPGAKPEGTVPGNILAIQFQIPANDEAEVSWDFCVTDLRVLTEADLSDEDTDTSSDTAE